MNISRFTPSAKALAATLARMPVAPKPTTPPEPIAEGEVGGAPLETFDRYVWQSLRSGPTTGVAELPYTFDQAWIEAHRANKETR